MSKMDILAIVRKVIQELRGEYEDDGQLSGAEVIEVLGQTLISIAGVPELAEWEGPLRMIGNLLISLAKKMGEDGV